MGLLKTKTRNRDNQFTDAPFGKRIKKACLTASNKGSQGSPQATFLTGTAFILIQTAHHQSTCNMRCLRKMFHEVPDWEEMPPFERGYCPYRYHLSYMTNAPKVSIIRTRLMPLKANGWRTQNVTKTSQYIGWTLMSYAPCASVQRTRRVRFIMHFTG